MWVGEAEEVPSTEELWKRHETGGTPSGLIDEVVPRVYFVLPERGEALQDVMCGRVGLGVE